MSTEANKNPRKQLFVTSIGWLAILLGIIIAASGLDNFFGIIFTISLVTGILLVLLGYITIRTKSWEGIINLFQGTYWGS